MSPSREGNDAAARRAKKRELDRRAQRAARERTRGRIAHLEATVQAMAHQESSGTIASLMEQLAETTRQRDDLSRLVSSIESSVHAHREAEKVVSEGPIPRPVEDNKAREQWPGLQESLGDVSVLPTHDTSMDLLSPSAIIDLTPFPPDDSFGLPTADYLDSILSPEAVSIHQNDLIAAETLSHSGCVIVPEPDKPCDCTSSTAHPGRPSSANHSIWRSANEALSGPELLSNHTLRYEDELSEDIPIQVILQGWDAVERSLNVPPLWRKLRRTDELQFSNCGKIERLAILLLMHRLLRYQAEPTADQYVKLPPWYLSRPSQSLPHSSAIDFFVWPGVRERFIFSQHQYCSNFFWKVFTENFRLSWPFEFRDCYKRNLHSGMYSVSPDFAERIHEIQAWTMAPDFFVHFPEMYADIPVFQSIPATVPWLKGGRQRSGQNARRFKGIAYGDRERQSGETSGSRFADGAVIEDDAANWLCSQQI